MDARTFIKVPMYRAAFLGILGLALVSTGAHSTVTQFSSSGEILKWINDYRHKPDPFKAADAIHKLSALGELRNPESAGAYLGFSAGILAANPDKADALVAKMLPMPAEDQWLVVRAIAYSGIPRWRFVLAKIRHRVPARNAMLEKYLQGRLPVLTQYKLETQKPNWFVRNLSFGRPKAKPVILEASPEVLDAFWGYYYATGSPMPIEKIIGMLDWSVNRDEVDKLTLGGMAKYTLASNASRDPALLAMIKSMQPSQPENLQKILKEVIEAADDVDVSRVRREMLASLDTLRAKGSETRRNISWWGQVGEGALAAGCIAAAVAGQVQIGIPCVVGGAVTAGGLRLWSSSQ
jgi:hypothetical protein